MQQLIITDAELADLFGTTHLGSHASQELSSRNLIYREVTPTELLRYEARVAEYMSSTIQPSGFSYQEKWNVGWSETLADFREDPNISSLVPKFVRKGLPIRYKGRWIMPLSDTFETDFVHVLRAFLVDKYLVGLDTLVEFGAGTGHNLVHMNQLGISRVVGFDWSESSVQLMSEIAVKMAIPLESYKLDMFDPVLPNLHNFGEHFSILTVGAMEQLGTKWQPFLELLNEQWHIKKKMTNKISNPMIDDIYDTALRNGAIGGKLLGAGGGGFMVFFAQKEQHKQIVDSLNSKMFVPFSFESTGSSIIHYTQEE